MILQNNPLCKLKLWLQANCLNSDAEGKKFEIFHQHSLFFGQDCDIWFGWFCFVLGLFNTETVEVC